MADAEDQQPINGAEATEEEDQGEVQTDQNQSTVDAVANGEQNTGEAEGDDGDKNVDEENGEQPEAEQENAEQDNVEQGDGEQGDDEQTAEQGEDGGEDKEEEERGEKEGDEVGESEVQEDREEEMDGQEEDKQKNTEEQEEEARQRTDIEESAQEQDAVEVEEESKEGNLNEEEDAEEQEMQEEDGERAGSQVQDAEKQDENVAQDEREEENLEAETGETIAQDEAETEQDDDDGQHEQVAQEEDVGDQAEVTEQEESKEEEAKDEEEKDDQEQEKEAMDTEEAEDISQTADLRTAEEQEEARETEETEAREKKAEVQQDAEEETGAVPDSEDQTEKAVEEPTGTELTNEQPEGNELAQAEGYTQEDTEQSQTMMKSKEESDLNINSAASTTEESQVPLPPHLPSMNRSHLDITGQMSTSALNIVWSFGLNRNVPVLNLSDGVRSAIMYPCAHVGIMYDYKNNKQHILQAHLNPITCSAISQDKRWLVTGDVGPDAMVNIWDTYTGTPIQTMFDPNPQGGVVAVAFTPDSRYLATLSALPIQTLAIWDWTVDGDVPICSADLKPEFGVQNYIEFDHTDIHHMATNSETQVLFYHWEENLMKYFAPPLSDSDFNKPVGRYSQTIFQKGIARALTATSIGNLVVWDNNRPLSKMYMKPEIDIWTGLPVMDVNQSADKKPLKIIKVHDKGINVLTTTDNYIVLGDTLGHVKFFDQGLRLIYWYQDFHSGPCTAISFAHIPDFMPIAGDNSAYPSDATKQAKPFVVRDFIVGTAIAVYCCITTDGSKMKVIHREHDAAVHALAAHPKLPIIAIGSYSGLLKLWNYRTKEVIASRTFEKYHIQCVEFDARGLYIAVGCTNGTVFVVDSVALLSQLKDPYKYARDAITHIAFSHNSAYFATADAGFTITVYKRQRKEGRNLYIWHGRYRSHYKPIKDLIFDVHLDTNEPKLTSLGEDRMLVEYDLNFSGKTNNHVVPCSLDRIEQAAIPQCMIKYPPITKEHFFVTANDQYKLKCYNSTTKMCRKTVLGPTYGSPIRRMMIVPTSAKQDQNRLMAYITDDKVGLHFLPATGNPHLAMALIAHPSGISNLTCSFDGAYLFTAGGPDFAVHMWEINTAALEAQCKLGGEDLVPFYGLLEGGRDGELFAELEELFYYAQLRNQGINCMERREIGTRVPLSEVPYIMRAMGFYPSEQEIEDMLNEVKYDEYVNLGHYQEDIDLGSLIKLYVNHRPAFGLSPDKLLWAFKTLSESPEMGKGGIIERGDFLDLLQKKGEHMTEFELAEHLTTLLGYNREGGSCEQEPFEADKAGGYIAESLPYDINAEILINEILGFSMTVDPPAPDDTKDVIKSGAF